MSQKKKKHREKFGSHGSSVVVFERQPGGTLYIGFYRNGKLVKRSLGHTDTARAEKQAYELLARGEQPKDRPVTVAEVVELYEAERLPNQTPEVQEQLAKQLKAWRGKSGALLWTVSAENGQTVSQLRLHTPPVFDGMAAARGRLYVTGMDGSVVCLEGK